MALKEALTGSIIDSGGSILGQYSIRSWSKERQVAVKAIRPEGSLLYMHFEFIITNIEELSAEDIYALYNKRGTMENHIKEIKNNFYFDKTDSSSFAANQMRMMVSCLAYNLVHLMKTTCLPEREQKSTLSTLRFKLFHIAGRGVHHARRVQIKLASQSIYSDLFWQVLAKIQSLALLT